ncbi:MAG: MoaD/ThiS family protein, partial [Candidatus Thorarchaeota archaeon]
SNIKIEYKFIHEDKYLININIKFLSLLADYAGEEESYLEVDKNSSVKDIIKNLSLKYGKNFSNKILDSQNVLNKYIILILNDVDIRSFNGLDTIVKEGDVLTFLPVIAGG